MNTNESGITESVSAEFGMSFDIDDIVRNVLEDVRLPAPEPESPAREEVPEDVPMVLRVISLEDVRNRQFINKQIVVSPKSLLTPSAKDELRKRNIEIVRREPAANRKSSPSGWCGVFPAGAASEALKTKLAKLLNRQLETFDALSEMLSAAEKQAERVPLRTAVITSSPASVMYAACRSAVLRPVFGMEPRQMSEDVAELQANMLILSSKSAFVVQKIEMAKAFLFGG